MTADYDSDNGQVPILRSTEPDHDPQLVTRWQAFSLCVFREACPNHLCSGIFSERVSKFSSFPGLNSSPTWVTTWNTPHSLYLKMVSQKFTITTRSGKYNRVTNNRAIDTEPAWSADRQAHLLYLRAWW